MPPSGTALRLPLLTLLLAGLAGCSGGGGAGQTGLPTTSPTTPAGPNSHTANVTFRIAIPAKGQLRVLTGPRPQYVPSTTQSVSITITNSGNNTTTTLRGTPQCGQSGCFVELTATLPVLQTPYTFSGTATGTSGRPLSSGSTQPTTLVPGANTVTLTLAPIADHASVSVTGTPVFGGAVQTLPITVQTFFDADGNAIPSNLTFFTPFQIGISELDPINAFSLVPVAPTPPTVCSVPPTSCSLRSSADTIALSFNPAAGQFTADPSYYPEEVVVDAAGGETITAQNSADVATPRCTPSPLCVYPQPFYPLLLSAGSFNGAEGLEFSPLLASTNGSTIYTDVATIGGAGGTAPAFYPFTGGSNFSSQYVSGIQYVSSTASAYTVDYSGDTAPDGNYYLDTISPTGVLTSAEYTPDPNNTYSGQGNGNDIILGPDGDLWWIDPLTGDLRYATPPAPGTGSITAGTCVLESNPNNLFLTAYQIVPTPAGVTPARIWFSAFDVVSDNFNYIGYVDITSPGVNSCGAGQTSGHYIKIANFSQGNNATPDGMAVDTSGNLWFNSADGNSNAGYTGIGEVTINGQGVLSTNRQPTNLPGFLGTSSLEAWDILFNPQDGNLYTAVDGGYVARFNPAQGPGSATVFTLPAPISQFFYDLTGDPDANDGSSCPTATFGEQCFPQFSWNPGPGSPGQLTFVLSPSSPGLSVADTAAQLNLSGLAFTTPSDATQAKHFHIGHKRTPRRRNTALRFGARF